MNSVLRVPELILLGKNAAEARNRRQPLSRCFTLSPVLKPDIFLMIASSSSGFSKFWRAEPVNESYVI